MALKIAPFHFMLDPSFSLSMCWEICELKRLKSSTQVKKEAMFRCGIVKNKIKSKVKRVVKTLSLC